VGSASTLAGELLAYMAHINIVRIPYKSGGARMTGLLSGEVQLDFATGAAYTTQLKQGKLKALGVTTMKRSPLWPGVPAISETVPGYQSSLPGGLFAPATTPAAIISRLSQEVQRLLNRPELRDRITNASIDVLGTTPEEFARYIKAEQERLGAVIKARGLREAK
jgi:tripartite-type tricarboxylate transporter receptor subunit TctC